MLDALSLPEADPATRRLVDALGGEPVAVNERPVGEPAIRSRRLLFAPGVEMILHDDSVVAVLLHLAPALLGPPGLDLSEWIAGVGNDATLKDLKQAMGVPLHFAGIGVPYFAVDGGYARFNFRGNRGWNDAGNLVGVTITVDRPGLACRPEDDDCPSCSDLLVRRSDSDGGVDVDGTTRSLAAALRAGLLTQDAHWVRLIDLRPLHASGLMARVESQLACTTCKRIICFTLFRDSAPTFGYYVMNDAMRRPLGAIPPVEQWGDATRIAQERDAMHYVDHEPGAWFLVEQLGVLYLDARYVITSMADDSALIRLDGSELEAYRGGGHAYLSDLATRIHDNGPHRENSPFSQRDLYRGPDANRYREAVTGAIANHTWLARQRRPPSA
ncbi:hypothetical protein OCAE111667_14150 [Occultella aeris]|uniref:Uncharacterized protein n=1 Tax=Occultella aeris TaxID=2761496 RepID=A0A7M4DIU7_9MICO|nr:hypothetical protein [Occultella aeris]VZO36911.1 hypothetical protein HALOF300_02050 [Occultella aeris]